MLSHLYITNKWIKLFIVLIGVFILFESCYKNFFKAAEDDFFQYFQQDSEALVSGKILADKYKLDTGVSNLGFFSIKENPKGGMIANQLTSGEKEYNKIPISNLVDANWTNGVNNLYNILLFDSSYYSNILTGAGCELTYGEQKRIIKDVLLVGPYVQIHYYGEKLTFIPNAREIFINYDVVDKNNFNYSNYFSQYGLQGKIYSYLFNNLDFKVKTIYKINCLLLSIVIVFLAYLSKKIFNLKFAIIFFISFCFSPWVISFARNLYWIEFSWFLPAIFIWSAYLTKLNKIKIICFTAFVTSALFKSLCGYEYLSSILLFASAPYIYKCFNCAKDLLLKQFCKIALIGILGTIGFIIAVIIHSYLLSNGDVLKGMKIIWEQEVLRRTYGDPNSFPEELAASLMSSVWSVIYTYIVNWKTNLLFCDKYVILGLNECSFCILLCFITFMFVYTIIYKKYRLFKKDFAIFITFLLPALSWFILAKSHSYVHVHMNYVLWYMGAIASLVYCLIKFLCAISFKIRKN